MQERARFMEGELTLTPAPEGGCCVTLMVSGTSMADPD